MSKKYSIACALAIVALIVLSGCLQQSNSAGTCENNCQDLFAQKKASCVTACGLSGKADAQCQADCNTGLQATIKGCVEDCKQKEGLEAGDESYCTTITGLSEYDECFVDIAVQYHRPADCMRVIDQNGELEGDMARDCLARIAKSDPGCFGPGAKSSECSEPVLATNLCDDPLFYYTTNQDGLKAGDARPERYTCETEAIGASQSNVNCTTIIAIMFVAVSAYACRKDGY